MSTFPGPILRKYSDKVDLIQAYFNAPPLTTVNVTYNPPEGYFFVAIDLPIGYMTSGIARAIAYFDNTLFFDSSGGGTVTGGWALDKIHKSYTSWYAKYDIRFQVTNYDTVYHTIDFTMTGILVPDHLLEEFMNEASGIANKNRLNEIISLLTNIGEKIGIPAPPPELPPPPPPEELPPLPPEIPAKKEWYHISDALTRQDELLEQILRAIQGTPPPEPPAEIQKQSSGSDYKELIEKLNDWHNSRRSG